MILTDLLDDNNNSNSNNDSNNTARTPISRLSSTAPHFDFLRYRRGEAPLLLHDYALYHRGVLNSTYPARYLFLTPSVRVGQGNRIEQTTYAFLIALLSGRAFLSEQRDPFDLSLMFNTSGAHGVRWANAPVTFARHLKHSVYFGVPPDMTESEKRRKHMLTLQRTPDLMSYFKSGNIAENFGDVPVVHLKELHMMQLQEPFNALFQNPVYVQ